MRPCYIFSIVSVRAMQPLPPVNATVSANAEPATVERARALQKSEDVSAALAVFQLCLAGQPRDANLHLEVGELCLRAGRIEQGLQRLHAALELAPGVGRFWISFVKGLLQAGRYAEGAGVLAAGRARGLAGQEIVELEKRVAAARVVELPAQALEAELIALAKQLQAQGHVLAAEYALVECVQRWSSIQALVAWAELCEGMKKYACAAYACGKAAELRPDIGFFHEREGDLHLIYVKDYGAAIDCFARAIRVNPESGLAHLGTGMALVNLRRPTEASAWFERAAALAPQDERPFSQLAGIHFDRGDFERAHAFFSKAYALNPLSSSGSGRLFVQNYMGQGDSAQRLQDALAWGAVHEQDAGTALLQRGEFVRKPLAGRKLRIGYISGDFRAHAVAKFIGRILAHHARNRLEIFAYHTSTDSDDVTERMRPLFDQWHAVSLLETSSAVSMIRSHELDVLIDLSGHTGLSRLPLLARRLAPVQAHYLGYFATTGLRTMDYWIGDEFLTPPEMDWQFSETVWRLPRCWIAYQIDQSTPVKGWNPASDGTIWVGSFNQISKLTDKTIEIWARLLRQAPEFKLFLKTKAFDQADARERITQAFAAQGVHADRLLMQGRDADSVQHFKAYHRIDVCLDPIGGVSGGTTSCDALWMGVPVITLPGDTMAQRMTASFLAAIGQTDWIANSEDAYINTAIALGRNVEARRQLRAGQRDRMAKSALCNAASLAQALEAAYLAMAQHWQDNYSATGLVR